MSETQEYDLAMLARVADEILSDLQKHQKAFINCNVNWADLHCVYALKSTNQYGEVTYSVLIEEADPGELRFKSFVADCLKNKGFPNVEVNLEW